MRESLKTSTQASCFLCLVSALLIALSACGGGSNTAPTEAKTGNTRASSTLPRTSLPMPPVATGHSAAVKAQSFTLLDESRRQLTDYAGQVVIVDFWATYCPPCVKEAPHLDSLQKKYGQQGLQVIGLNVGGPDDRGEIPKFLKETSLTYPIGFPEPEMVNLYMRDNDVIPQTFVFSRQGRLLKHYIGYDDRMQLDLEQLIGQAMAQPAQ
jgi:thiol-disulfide isomerase/thioredoxin